MILMKTVAAIVVGVVLLIGPSDRGLAQSGERKPVDLANAGGLTGRAVFRGTPPPREAVNMQADPVCIQAGGADAQTETVLVDRAGGLQNVFVHVKEGLDPAYSFDPPAGSVVLDQRGCRFSPRVLGVRTNQRLEILNGDPTLQNVHAHAAANEEFNIGQPIQGMRFEHIFTVPEVMIALTSDVHRWMAAFVGVVAHPFFAVTDPGGSFTMTGLPPGSYTIEAWHETLGTATQSVTVGARQTANVTFTFAGPPLSAQPPARDRESPTTEYEILVASNAGVFVIEARSGRVISRLSSHRATSAELMPNGNVLLVDDAIREVTLNGTEVRNLPLPYSATNHALPYTSDTMWVSVPVSGGNQLGIIALVDWQGKASITLPRFHYPFQARRLTDDHILVADGSSSLTELSGAGEVSRTIGLSQWATAIAITKEGDIYYGRPDGYSHLSSTGSEVSTMSDMRVESIDCLPSGNLIIASALGNFIREVTPEGARVWSIAFDGPNNVRFIR